MLTGYEIREEDQEAIGEEQDGRLQDLHSNCRFEKGTNLNSSFGFIETHGSFFWGI
jgi:hypothetical protein